MGRFNRCLLALIGLSFVNVATVGLAAQTPEPEERIQGAAVRVDRAATALGEAAASERLAAAFRVRSQVVMDLRDQKLNYGEVAVVLALSETGEASPDTILGLWTSGRLNWGQIAERLKVDPRNLLRRLEVVRRDLARRTP